MNYSPGRVLVVLSLLTMSAVVLCLQQTAAATETTGDFEREIAPLLIRRCVECHQERDPSGSLILTTRAGLLAGGDSGAAVDLKAPADSFLLTRVHDGEMPPQKQGRTQKLPDAEAQLLERWIAAGAPWPEQRTLDLFEQTTDLRGGRDWWSLQPVRRPAIPQLQSQPQNPIDAFVLARLEQNRMVAAPTADKRTLLRRLYYDLTGLPPTQSQIEAFESDTSATAWETQVDLLLDSPHYGERWARYWLDLVRYADTSGYERDQEKPFAWKYRDWVVNALNSDMPYDRFIVQQLAGDEIPDRDEQSVIATGFLRLGTWNDEPNDPLDYQYERLEDLVHTTSSAFLGMTVKCARCHSHKFDAITHEDYHRMASAFWAGPIGARDRNLLGGPSKDELQVSDVLGWTDLSPSPPPLHVLKNGERHRPLQEVRPASLSMIPALERPFDPPPAGSSTSHRRLQLAQWIANPQNPLTARVLVNRLWLHHFGEGLVRSPNNFGFLADPPTHPELLDWLAAEFVDGGWTLKRLHRLIVTSHTWRQSSVHPQFAAYQQADAGNRLWWHAARRRLDAEAMRDSMLATTGELDLRMGGPGFRPTISADALEGLSMKSAAWQPSPPQEQNRRSLYVYSKRGLLPPMMTTFDLCDTTQPCGQRDVTTSPTQTLTLMNNPFVHERSEALANRIAAESSDLSQQVAGLWVQIYGRQPTPSESQLAEAHLQRQQRRFTEQRAQEQASGESDPADTAQRLPAIERLAESLVLHLRADDGVTLDDDGRVTEWRDRSPHQHHASQSSAASRPSWSHDGFAGRPALSFDGQGRFLNLSGSLLTDQHCTLVAVVDDQEGGPGHRSIISNWNGSAGNFGTSLFLGLTAQNTVRFSDAFPDAGQIAEQQLPFVIAAVNGADQVAVLQNGKRLASRDGSLPARNLSTSWVIGQQGNINGEFWNGHIAEVRVYACALSAEELRSVIVEIAARYGIQLAPASAPQSGRAERLSPESLALASLAHVLLNSNEFLYVD